METTKILQADVLDIIFDGRNKTYGAYELRLNYTKRLYKALAITFGIIITAVAIIWAKTSLAKESVIKAKITEVTLAKYKEPEKEIPKYLPPPPPPKVEPLKIKKIDFTTPIVTKENVVTPPPTQDQIAESQISNITQQGANYTGIVTPPESADKGQGLIPTDNKHKKDNDDFSIIEIEATYPGGASAWKRYLERNLRGDVAVDNNATPGSYTVIIEFVVDVDGTVSNLRPVTKMGHGMEEEAVRVIQKSGKWKPAIQNGQQVKAPRKQPVTFQVVEQ